MNLPNNVEKHIGQYRILRTLGAGGMGTVYLGEHLLLGRRAAIKTLLPALSTQRTIVDRFFTEARAISAISDPGVVQIFDFGYHVDGTAYIVMEFLEGEPLSTRLHRLGRLRVTDALRLARQLASSLEAAHELGIVHRDLKPANVFVIRDSEVQGGERTKILDFGICKLGDSEEATVTQSGAVLGTPVYMSPEQCRGAGCVDQRSDIYSLGAVLFHMLTGRPPFQHECVGDYIASHIKDPPVAPSSVAPDLPPVLDDLLLCCLAKSPAERFQSMAELQAALEAALEDVVENTAAPVTPDDPILLTTARRQTPLGEGFQSWYVDSLEVDRVSMTWDIVKPPSRWGRRLAFLLALGTGVVSGTYATGYVLEAEAAELVAAPEEPVPESAEILEPHVVARAFEVAPPEAIADLMPPPVSQSHGARRHRTR